MHQAMFITISYDSDQKKVTALTIFLQEHNNNLTFNYSYLFNSIQWKHLQKFHLIFVRQSTLIWNAISWSHFLCPSTFSMQLCQLQETVQSQITYNTYLFMLHGNNNLSYDQDSLEITASFVSLRKCLCLRQADGWNTHSQTTGYENREKFPTKIHTVI